MDTIIWILVVVVVLLVALALAGVLLRQRRSRSLQEGFGPEYDRTLARAGDRREAEAELADRRHRRRELDITPLDPQLRERYREQWRGTQALFVDDPAQAVREADALVTHVMHDRGYPAGDDVEQQAAVVSVDHPGVTENYRAAHALFRAHEQGLAGTDDLRQAFVHYRSLFAELLDDEKETRHDTAR